MNFQNVAELVISSSFPVVLQILGYSAFFCVPVPATTIAQLRAPTDPAFGGFDKLSMGNIAKKNKSRIWAFLLAAYWLSIVTYIVLWRKYKHIINLRGFLLMQGQSNSLC
ncbi:hypothetical protein O6H91_01G084800 [Diphasiastrum complanatum]|uniref:Uncharacterized protein n=1 Tax=Diphasiastrum complanatum TaxID=34168 RepID=A0ACC2ET18_DIPCM|nr:hypothetical protein O6H91_01G084800 [Diphasiastrum complanatum]